MNAAVQSYPAPVNSVLMLRLTAVIRRLPLVLVTLLFTMIGLRYLFNPIHAAAATGISFTSPGGVTVARVGFAGFPLAFAILAFACLISTPRLLTGLYMSLTVVAVVTLVRILGIAVDHSAAENARLLVPETVLIILFTIAIRLESIRRRREAR